MGLVSLLKFSTGVGEIAFGSYILYSHDFAQRTISYIVNYIPPAENYANYLAVGVASLSMLVGALTIKETK
jgi:endo-1,4-beta-mannosidase